MKAAPTALPGVLVIEPRVFADARGFFKETWHEGRYGAAGAAGCSAQSNHSRSRRGVLRGLHFQQPRPQAKLVWAVSGEIFDVAVDIRRGSPTFGRWVSAVLSGENHRQMYIPAGFAHGFLTLSESADVVYQCSEVYDPACDRGVRWDDPTLAIAWPAGERIVSPKDAALPLLDEADLPQYKPPSPSRGEDEGWGGPKHGDDHP